MVHVSKIQIYFTCKLLFIAILIIEQNSSEGGSYSIEPPIFKNFPLMGVAPPPPPN